MEFLSVLLLQVKFDIQGNPGIIDGTFWLRGGVGVQWFAPLPLWRKFAKA